MDALRRSLEGAGGLRDLMPVVDSIVRGIEADLRYLDTGSRDRILAEVCDGLITLIGAGQTNPELLRSYATTKVQELLREVRLP
jgi:hypothetical protein